MLLRPGVSLKASGCLDGLHDGQWRGWRIATGEHDVIGNDALSVCEQYLQRCGAVRALDGAHLRMQALESHVLGRCQLGSQQDLHQILSVERTRQKIFAARRGIATLRKSEKLQWILGACRHARSQAH